MRFVGIVAVFAVGCSIESGESVGAELVRSHISDLVTSVNPLGSFAGPCIPNLQVDHLDPGEYTLQFQVVQSVIDGLQQSTYAIARWKVRGQQIQRIISVFSGAVLGGVAEAVDVQLQDQSGRGTVGHGTYLPGPVLVVGTLVTFPALVTLLAGEQIFFTTQPNVSYVVAETVVNSFTVTITVPYTGIGAPINAYALGQYKIGVTLSKGTRPPIQQPPVLSTMSEAVILLPGAGFTLAIPQDAGVISAFSMVSVDGISPQAGAVDGYVSFGGPVGLIASYIPFTFPGWTPIPPGATRASFVNGSTTDTLDFFLQWGIEG